MSQNTTAAQPRTVQTADRGKLDVRALVLLAILLAAGFILNFTVGKDASLDELRATRERHRSPLILQCVEDYIAGRRFSLDLLRHYDA